MTSLFVKLWLIFSDPDILVDGIKTLFSRKWFHWVIIFVFVTQAGVVALSQSNVRNMDERRLTEFVTYYSSTPVLTGPIVSGLPPELAYIGAMERTHSYLYMYLISFVDRFIHGVTDISNFGALVIMRLVTVLSGVGVLLILRKIVLDFRRPRWMANGTMLLFSLTSSFVYVSAMVSYDAPSLLLMLSLTWCLMRLVQRHSLSYIWPSILLLPIIFLTKYTYFPVAAIMVMMALGVYLWAHGTTWRSIVQEVVHRWRTSKYQVLVYVLLLSLFSGLVIERVAGNLIVYDKFVPTCDQVFSRESCYKTSSIYKRSVDQKASKLAGSLDRFEPEPVSFTLSWINRMYRGLFFDIDGYFRYPGWAMLSLSWALGLIVAVAVCFKRRAIPRDKGEILVLWGAFIYLTTVFSYNLKSYLSTGEPNAQHGRYVHFTLAFIFLLVIQLFADYWRHFDQSMKRVVAIPAMMIMGVTALLYLPLVQYFYYTPVEWFTPPFASLVTYLPFR